MIRNGWKLHTATGRTTTARITSSLLFIYKVYYMSQENVIPKIDLVIGQYYHGNCRNAVIARWNGTQFIYIRTKFGSTYPEAINHPEDFDGYDCFKPNGIASNPSYEIPMDTE